MYEERVTPDMRLLSDSYSSTPEASVDHLTGFGNMFGLLQSLEQRLEVTQRHPGSLLALIFMDIDDLSVINKTVGTEVADYMIRTAVSAMYRTMCDVFPRDCQPELFRFSGDAFAIVVSFSHCEELKKKVRGIQSAVSELTWEHYPRPITFTASLACFPSCSSSLGHLMAYTYLFNRKAKETSRGGLACPGSSEHQDTGLLYIDLHNIAPMLIQSLCSNVIQTAQLLGAAQHLAHTDPLTGIPNLRAARGKLSNMIKEAEQDMPLSIMLVDGDKLKAYNQMWGYEAGNDMIKWLAQRLLSHTPQDCFIGRWLSGDEFLILCPGYNASQCAELAEVLRYEVEQGSSELKLPITISIGISSFPYDGIEAEQLTRAAEEANNNAKLAGRNRVSLSPAIPR